MNIYDKITSCDKIVCFIEGVNINCMSIFYKKKVLESQFYLATMTFIADTATNFPIKEITICGYETENSKTLKSLFSGNYVELQKAMRGVI